MKIGAVVLAAGLSRRFGQNKLLVEIENKPMVGYALDVIQAVSGLRMAAVVSDQGVAAYMCTRGVQVILNERPELGQAHSIVLAVDAMQDMDAILLVAGDQPKLTGESMIRLIECYCASGKGIACLRDETHAGNPSIFSSAYFAELMRLKGDCGAKRIIRRYSYDVIEVPCVYPGELSDADTPQALVQLTQ